VILLFILVALLPLACNKSSDENSATKTAAGEDARITSAVKDKISSDPTLSYAKIDVDTDNAVVTLKGEVKNPTQEQKAIQVAEGVSGVRTVHSFIKVEEVSGAGSLGTQAEEAGKKIEQAAKDAGTKAEGTGEKIEDAARDAEITTKVKFELAKDKRVSATDIHVDTKNGVVTLTGDVKNKVDIERAIRIARGVEGVKDVNSELTVNDAS